MWRKYIYLHKNQIELIKKIVTRISRRVKYAGRLSKVRVGRVRFRRIKFKLEEYNMLVDVFNSLMSHKNTLYEADGMLNYSDMEIDADKTEIMLPKEQADLLLEIVQSFIEQNNGIEAGKVDLRKMKVNRDDYLNLKEMEKTLSKAG